MGALKVGFIGLGNIGKPMALRLAAEADLELTVFDIAADPVAELVAAGAAAASSVAELAQQVEVLSVMVRDDDQVRSVLDDVLAVDATVRVVVVHSTVAPSTPAELAKTAADKGIAVLDAPVSGGAAGAAEGSLAIMVGGDATAFEAARPALAAMGSKLVLAGDIGAGTAFKLCRNMMHFASFTAATEAQRLAEAAGLDIVALGDVVRHTDAITGGPGAIMHRNTTAPIAEGDFWMGVFEHVRALGEKDLGFALDLASELGVDTPLARIARERFASGLGLPD